MSRPSLRTKGVVVVALSSFALAAGTALGASTARDRPQDQNPSSRSTTRANAQTPVEAAGPAISRAQPATSGPTQGSDAEASPDRQPRAPRTPQTEDRTAEEPNRVLEGRASWYGPGFAGQTTASGEIYDPGEMVAAHKSLPLGTRVRVTNERNGETVELRVIDRGPYAGGRILDVSSAAANELNMKGSGVAPVTVEVLS